MKNNKNKVKEIQNVSPIIDKDSSFRAKEAYKTLRTNILFALPKSEGSKVVMFTSACPGEGKTTTLINTAISFVELGKKIVIVDCDLRKPKVHKYTNIKSKVGISNVLGGFSKIEECIVKTDYGFDCMVAGHTPPNPSELLSSQQMIDIINQLKSMYDIVLLDSPPINIVSETATLAPLTDGVLLIASHASSTKQEFERAISILKFTNAKILGFVLNNAKVQLTTYSKASKKTLFSKLKKNSGGYYYNYGYGYGYGYKYDGKSSDESI